MRRFAGRFGLCVYIAASCLLAYFFPQSVLAFFLVEASLLLLYYMRCAAPDQNFSRCLVLLVLLPILGSVNGYYLEIAIQIGIFVALALGLNIVVGFVGLTQFRFRRFLRHRRLSLGDLRLASGQCVYSGGLFPLSPNWFFVFLVLSIVVGALTGVLSWACRYCVCAAIISPSLLWASPKSCARW